MSGAPRADAEAEATDARRGWSLRGVAEALLIYAALPATLMYPLGLLILCLQIRLAHLESLTAAWYAANLVPRPVAMGVGLGAAWGALARTGAGSFAAIFVVGAAAMALFASRKRRKPVAEHEEAAAQNIAKARYHVRIPVVDLVLLPPNRVAAAAMVGLPLAWVALTVAGLAYLAAVEGEWAYALSRAALLSGFVLGLLLLSRDALDVQYGRGTLARAPLRGSAVMFAGLLLAALLGSAAREPSLPRVELGGGGARTEGELLAHEGGYWYVFEDGSPGLRAVPDARAEDVAIEGGPR